MTTKRKRDTTCVMSREQAVSSTGNIKRQRISTGERIYVVEPNPDVDILGGKGKGNENAPGNQRFRGVISTMFQSYDSPGRKERKDIRQEIAGRMKNEGRRFLRPFVSGPHQGKHYEISAKDIDTKIMLAMNDERRVERSKQSKMKRLPSNFVPSDDTVVLGPIGKSEYAGTKKCHDLVRNLLSEYWSGTRLKKQSLVAKVVDTMNSPTALFVVRESDMWYEVGKKEVQRRVLHMFHTMNKNQRVQSDPAKRHEHNEQMRLAYEKRRAQCDPAKRHEEYERSKQRKHDTSNTVETHSEQSGLPGDVSTVVESTAIPSSDDKSITLGHSPPPVDSSVTETSTNSSLGSDIRDPLVSDKETDDSDKSNRKLNRTTHGKKDKLFMDIQWFRAPLMERSNQAGVDNGSRHDKSSVYDDLQRVTYNQRVFRRNRCYQYKMKVAGKNIKLIIGIKRFISTEEALCVLVVPFEDTWLGCAERENDAGTDKSKPISSHLQVFQQTRILHLNQLRRKSGRNGVKHIPKWIYDPLWDEEDRGVCFGYFLEDEGIKRNGRSEKLRAVELFSGAGGCHLGVENAGFASIAAVDNDAMATATMRRNCPMARVFEESVESFLKKRIWLRDHWDPVDLLVCTPPCQGFSGANRNGGKDDEANNDLSLAVVKAAKRLHPRGIMFENVMGMWRRENIRYLQRIVQGLMRLKYQVRVAELRACDYGIAQKRPRLIILATKTSCPAPMIPRPTHGTEQGLLPLVTVGDVLSGLESGIDIDGASLANTRHAKVESAEAVKLKVDELAPTIRASGVKPLHYKHDRCISVRECASLQDFPTNYEICGTLTQQYQQVGNAVPVQLATKIAQSMRDVLAFDYLPRRKRRRGRT